MGNAVSVSLLAAANSTNDVAVLLFWGLLAVVVAIGVISSNKKQAAAKEVAQHLQQQQAREQQAVVEGDRTRQLMPISSGGLVLKSNESVFYRSPAQTMVLRNHPTFVGGYSGVSVRVARGLYARTGSSRGKRVDNVTADIDDNGTLFVTNLRIVFIGAKKTTDIPFAKVAAIEPYTDGFKANRSNATAVVFITGSESAAIITQRAMAGDVMTNEKVAAEKAALLQKALDLFEEAKKQHAAGNMNDDDFAKAEATIERMKAR